MVSLLAPAFKRTFTVSARPLREAHISAVKPFYTYIEAGSSKEKKQIEKQEKERHKELMSEKCGEDD